MCGQHLLPFQSARLYWAIFWILHTIYYFRFYILICLRNSVVVRVALSVNIANSTTKISMYFCGCVYLCVCACVFVIHSKIAQLMVKLFCFFGLDSESLWVSAAVAVRQKNSSISRNDLRSETRCQRHIKRNKLAGEPSISGHINCLYCC